MIEKIISYLNKVVSDSKPTFNNELVSEDKFNTYDENVGVCKIYAVDGGSSIIADGGAWFIGLVRVGYVVYENKNLLDSSTYEYMVLVSVLNNKISNIFYSDKLPIVPDESLIREIKIEKGKELEILSKIMKISEWYLTNNLIKKADKGDIILIDGLLYNDDLTNIVEPILSNAKLKNVYVIGLAKTSRLSLDNGRSLLGYLFELGGKKRWYYKLNDYDYVVKLHPNSNFCYRLQVEKFQNKFLEKYDKLRNILGIISYYSRDSMLLGYPFPLIKVDQISRIQSRKVNDFKWKLSTVNNSIIRNDLKSMGFHKEIDMRMYR